MLGTPKGGGPCIAKAPGHAVLCSGWDGGKSSRPKQRAAPVLEHVNCWLLGRQS